MCDGIGTFHQPQLLSFLHQFHWIHSQRFVTSLCFIHNLWCFYSPDYSILLHSEFTSQDLNHLVAFFHAEIGCWTMVLSLVAIEAIDILWWINQFIPKMLKWSLHIIAPNLMLPYFVKWGLGYVVHHLMFTGSSCTESDTADYNFCVIKLQACRLLSKAIEWSI